MTGTARGQSIGEAFDPFAETTPNGSRLEELITRFDFYREQSGHLPAEDARMRRDIALEIQNDQPRGAERGRRDTATVAFTISYQGRDPEVAAQVANTLASFYVEENLKVRERLASGTTYCLKAQGPR